MEDAGTKRSALTLRGKLEGHNGAITQLATSPSNPNTLISSSRDKSVLVWDLQQYGDEIVGGRPLKSLLGHGHFVSDVALSHDGHFALTGSWDRTLRLWDLNTGKTSRQFIAHTKDVLSVAFSADNRQIVSGGRDRTIRLWNTLAQCKLTLSEKDEGHSHWVSSVRFASTSPSPSIVSAGWDKVVKVWNLSNCRLKTNHIGHTGFINATTVSPDGSLCASGGKDGIANLWDLTENKHLYQLDAQDVINALTFSPNRYWLCAAVGSTIRIFDLEHRSTLDELKLDVSGTAAPQCTSLSWSQDGNTLFAGYSDNTIRIWGVADWIKAEGI
ncbi:unnamed protein product [Bursaphelenchus okinawaensis]|uniref:Small ribosomal subunit protein RACK1 n=1 Tax=Bursaphelenchus okinawaensis TaxID=465554 RepID=A0A811KS90_9BILA|nr:unnamed protein product [Bursaphelenchus okinawaensis]CAG9109596.1 unnamed protein product [Bursaphelenchus okinawaensis]